MAEAAHIFPDPHQKARKVRESDVKRTKRSHKKFVRLRSLKKRFPELVSQIRDDEQSDTIPNFFLDAGKNELTLLETLASKQLIRINEMICLEKESNTWIQDVRKEIKELVNTIKDMHQIKIDIGVRVPLTPRVAEALEYAYVILEHNRGQSLRDAFMDFLFQSYENHKHHNRLNSDPPNPELETIRSLATR